jgi:hypothetical protein
MGYRPPLRNFCAILWDKILKVVWEAGWLRFLGGAGSGGVLSRRGAFAAWSSRSGWPRSRQFYGTRTRGLGLRRGPRLHIGPRVQHGPRMQFGPRLHEGATAELLGLAF